MIEEIKELLEANEVCEDLVCGWIIKALTTVLINYSLEAGITLEDIREQLHLIKEEI